MEFRSANLRQEQECKDEDNLTLENMINMIVIDGQVNDVKIDRLPFLLIRKMIRLMAEQLLSANRVQNSDDFVLPMSEGREGENMGGPRKEDCVVVWLAKLIEFGRNPQHLWQVIQQQANTMLTVASDHDIAMPSLSQLVLPSMQCFCQMN
jgi:hypothetical protein